MIPDKRRIEEFWEKYHIPERKRKHCEIVADVALFFAKKLREKGIEIDEHLLFAAAYLHDIDKNIEKLPGEKHPDTVVRILKQEGMDEVAEVVRTHPLHMILDAKNAPKTIEQKVLFLADKMTRYECIGIQKRFEIWKKEDYDEESQAILDASYPKVKALEDKITSMIGISEQNVIQLYEKKYSPLARMN